MSQPPVLKAEEDYRHDYWFTSEGIYRIKIIPYRYVLLAFFGMYALGSIAAGFLLPSLAYVGVILIFAPSVITYLLLKSMAKGRRIRFGSPPPRAVLEDSKVSSKMPWEEIKRVSLIRRHNVRISFGIHVYRGTIKKQDYEILKDFLLLRIGDRLALREGAF